MKSARRVRALARIASVGVSATVLLALVASPASAAPPPLATANAAHVTGLLNLSTGTCNFPSGGASDSCSPNGTGNMNALLAASVLTQNAGSNATGPFACGGASGPGGGLVQIGPGAACPSLATVQNNPSTGGGVVVLGGLVVANAVYATCQGTPTGVTGGSIVLGIPALLGTGTNSLATLLNLNLTNLLSSLGTIQITGNLNPGSSPSTVTVTLAPLLGAAVPLLNLFLNQTTTSGGATTFTALELQVLPGFSGLAGSVPAIGTLLTGLGITLGNITGTAPVLDVVIGQATCSPTPPTPPTDIVPVAGTPIAAGMLLIAGYLGYRFWWNPRRRAASVSL